MRYVVRPQKNRNQATLASAQMTQNQWGIALLRALGNVSPSIQVQVFIASWGQAEGGGGDLVLGSTNRCRGNMLNTEQRIPGSVSCQKGCSNARQNCVQSYLSNNDGIAANAMALRNGNYPHLLQALVTNDADSLGYNNHQMTTEIAKELTTWGTNIGTVSTVAGVRSASGIQTPSGTGSAGSQGGSNTSSQKPSGNIFTDALNSILGQGTLDWIRNPMRVIKMLVGVMCIGLSIYLLVAPDAMSAVSKVAPFLA